MLVINELIALKLPYINLSAVPVLNKVNLAKKEVLYLLEPYLNKANTEDENLYTNQERSLIATYTAYNLLYTKAISTVAGDVSIGGAVTDNKVLTKAKADVVESEFTIAKAADGVNIAMSGERLMQELKAQLCSLANQMNIPIAICDCGEAIPAPFIFVRS
jgi:hypothetical protein